MIYVQRKALYGATKRPKVKWFVCMDRKVIKVCKTKREAFDYASCYAAWDITLGEL